MKTTRTLNAKLCLERGKKNESIILAQSTNGETEEKDRNETCAFVDLFVHTACHKLW